MPLEWFSFADKDIALGREVDSIKGVGGGIHQKMGFLDFALGNPFEMIGSLQFPLRRNREHVYRYAEGKKAILAFGVRS